MTGDLHTDLRASVILGALEAAEKYVKCGDESAVPIPDCECEDCQTLRLLREAIALVKQP